MSKRPLVGVEAVLIRLDPLHNNALSEVNGVGNIPRPDAVHQHFTNLLNAHIHVKIPPGVLLSPLIRFVRLPEVVAPKRGHVLELCR